MRAFKYEEINELTTGGKHLNLLHRVHFIEEGARAQQVERSLAIVSDGDLDLRVTRSSELDAQGGFAPVDADSGCARQGGDGQLNETPHDE